MPNLVFVRLAGTRPHIGEIVEKIAYTRNGKDTPNIQIGITSFLNKISTQIMRI